MAEESKIRSVAATTRNRGVPRSHMKSQITRSLNIQRSTNVDVPVNCRSINRPTVRHNDISRLDVQIAA